MAMNVRVYRGSKRCIFLKKTLYIQISYRIVLNLYFF